MYGFHGSRSLSAFELVTILDHGNQSSSALQAATHKVWNEYFSQHLLSDRERSWLALD